MGGGFAPSYVVHPFLCCLYLSLILSLEAVDGCFPLARPVYLFIGLFVCLCILVSLFLVSQSVCNSPIVFHHFASDCLLDITPFFLVYFTVVVSYPKVIWDMDGTFRWCCRAFAIPLQNYLSVLKGLLFVIILNHTFCWPSTVLTSFSKFPPAHCFCWLSHDLLIHQITHYCWWLSPHYQPLLTNPGATPSRPTLQVYVVGSGSQLGEWSPDSALVLTTGPQERWLREAS